MPLGPRPILHGDLANLLRNVWENRDQILYTPPLLNSEGEPLPEDATVEERVYALYAPNAPKLGGIDAQEYRNRLYGIVSPPGKVLWTRDIRGTFHVWDAGGRASGHAAYRVYLNPKIENAVEMFKLVMDMTSVPRPLPTPPNVRAAPQPVIPEHVLRAGLVSAARRGQFGGTIASAKIADEREAFTNRPDKIVIYVNSVAGKEVASLLAAELSKKQNWLNPDIPPMTQRVAMGVSTGPEVAVRQFSIGTSFGGLRCNLIARALIVVVTGRAYEHLDMVFSAWGPGDMFAVAPVPIPLPRVGSPDRFAFEAEVARLFSTNGVNPAAPWE